MANLRAIRNRIRSVNSTQKITRAMKMVAAARLRRSQEAVSQSKAYQEKVRSLLAKLLPFVEDSVDPLLKRPQGNKRYLVVLSSDRGLCGAFNASLFRKVESALSQTEYETSLILIGKKAISYFRNQKDKIHHIVEDYWTDFDHQKAKNLCQNLTQDFLDGKVDRIEILYNEFQSVMTQKPKSLTLLPLQKEESQGAENDLEQEIDYLFEPGKAQIIQLLLPKAVEGSFYQANLHSLASEYGARMTAMDAATRNAGEMIDSLTLHMNRVRQAAITNELVEIISGAEAIQ
ncbi:MAG: ATP synthase F1 subunit gamma [Bdellovibrionales bacterium]|nr:ATP synthase F1 subunit gamma [Bdellovibrionales bacterium]